MELSCRLGLRVAEVGGDEAKAKAKAKAFVKALFEHVPVLDTGARGATSTFTQRGIGDVLLAWENEALLVKRTPVGNQFEIVVPSPTSGRGI